MDFSWGQKIVALGDKKAPQWGAGRMRSAQCAPSFKLKLGVSIFWPLCAHPSCPFAVPSCPQVTGGYRHVFFGHKWPKIKILPLCGAFLPPKCGDLLTPAKIHFLAQI